MLSLLKPCVHVGREMDHLAHTTPSGLAGQPGYYVRSVLSEFDGSGDPYVQRVLRETADHPTMRRLVQVARVHLGRVGVGMSQQHSTIEGRWAAS